MPLAFEQQFNVQHSETDPWDRMTPGAILRRVQQIATDHCTHLGIHDDMYKKTQTAFVLSRISLKVNRMAAPNDAITIKTQASGMRRAVFNRVTALYDSNGEMLCETDSRWVLIDTKARHILRHPPEGFYNPFTDEALDVEHKMTMPKPGVLLRLGSAYASYSLCDRNHHLNNSRYADIVCDHLPLANLAQAPVARMLIFYRSEIPLGHTFTVMAAPVEADGYYFCGENNGSKHFETYISFKKQEE